MWVWGYCCLHVVMTFIFPCDLYIWSNPYILVYDNSSWQDCFLMCRISVKLLQGLCALCVHAHYLTDPLEAQAWVNLGLISPSDLEPLSFISFACVLHLVVYTSVSFLFFFPPNDCCFISHTIQCCVFFMAISKGINKTISPIKHFGTAVLHPQQIDRCHWAEWCSWHTWRIGCCPEGPGPAGEVGP